jgi:hypothetical protein
MSDGRFVVAGLAPPRTGWFAEVAAWATSGSLPADFVKCISPAELAARLAGGRAFSAVLADGATSGLDRDLIDQARAAGAVVLVVDDGRGRPWTDLGVNAVLDLPLRPDSLLSALADVATPITTATTRALRPIPAGEMSTPATWVTVTGAGGSGTSTTAMALAAGLARRHHDHHVVLADLALHADQAMLHDATDLVPAISELVDASRTRRLSRTEVLDHTFTDDRVPYRLLLGLRRHRDWSALRPLAVRVALDGLRHACDWVVADADPDVEGDRRIGSVDVEERNQLARQSVTRADVVIVTARAQTTGIHRFVHLLDDLVDHGLDPSRVLPVLTHAPRSPSARSGLSRAVAELSRPLSGASPLASPLYLGDRRRVDPAGFDAARPPASWGDQLATAVEALMARVGTAATTSADEPEPVAPGSLGSWLDTEEAAG